MIVGPTVPVDIIKPICKNYKSKLIIADTQGSSFMSLNRAIALAVYKQVEKNEKKM
jgi:hypothetical protein